MIESISQDADGVRVTVGSTGELFTWRWLRDHGEDAASLDADTLQRKVDTFSISDSVEGRATLCNGDDTIRIEWADESPDTTCTEALFVRMLGLDGLPGPELWPSGSPTSESVRTSFDELCDDDTALLRWLERVETTGFTVVSGLPPTAAAAKQLAERIAPPRSTVFGRVWRLAAEMQDHQDSAYSTTFLEPHTDNTYFTDAPGSLLFCCEQRTGSGGESILVDGFAIAEELRTSSPEVFQVLTTVPVPGRYVESGVHYEAERPAIRLDSAGHMQQVSFNNYDRSPMWLPEPLMSDFYTAYSEMHSLIVDQGRWLETRLEPGDALLFDNWRLLHGRKEYTGTRVFHGCYHDRDEYQSRLRTLRAALS